MSGRLVYDEDEVCLEQHPERRCRVGDGLVRRAFGELDLHGFTERRDVALRAFSPLAFLAPEHAHAPFAEQALGAGATEPGHAIHEKFVEPSSGEIGIDFDTHAVTL